MQAKVSVAPGVPELAQAAEQLARELVLPIAALGDPAYDVQLVVTESRLELREVASRSGPVYVDFVGGRSRVRRQGGRLTRDLLVRAVGRPKGADWRVLDATAGLGRDAFVLAWAGCTVTAVERSVVLAALLEDGWGRAMREADVGAVVADRLSVIKGDARDLLARLPEAQRPDAVYIDPMFPQRAKTAASKKEMQLTRLVTGDDPDAAQLLQIARRVARHRVVVKRWLHAPPVAPKPTVQYKGQSIRYDAYLVGMAAHGRSA